jgi:hypothetical protein
MDIIARLIIVELHRIVPRKFRSGAISSTEQCWVWFRLPHCFVDGTQF